MSYSYDRTATHGLIVTPGRILQVAEHGGLITREEAHSRKVQRAAQWSAEAISEGWPEGEGFGSSDMTSVLESFMTEADIPSEFKNHRLVRKQ